MSRVVESFRRAAGALAAEHVYGQCSREIEFAPGYRFSFSWAPWGWAQVRGFVITHPGGTFIGWSTLEAERFPCRQPGLTVGATPGAESGAGSAVCP